MRQRNKAFPLAASDKSLLQVPGGGSNVSALEGVIVSAFFSLNLHLTGYKRECVIYLSGSRGATVNSNIKSVLFLNLLHCTTFWMRPGVSTALNRRP